MKGDMKNKDITSDKKNTDSQITENKKPTKGSNKNRYSLRSKHHRLNNSNEKKYSRSRSNNTDSDSGSTTSGESEEDFDQREYSKFLSKMFPSKYINKRVAEILDEDDETETEESTEKKTKKKSSNKKRPCKRHERETESESESESETLGEDTTDEEDDMYGTIYSRKKAFNILVSLDAPSYYEDEDEDTDSDDDSYSEEDSEDEDNMEKKKTTPKDYTELDSKILYQFATIAAELKEEHGDSQILKELVDIGNDKRKLIEHRSKKEKKKQTQKNTKEFTKLLKDKRKETDFSLFKKMDMDEQKTLIEKLEEIKKFNDDAKPIRIGLLETDIPVQYKAVAMRKMNTLDYMEPGTNEFYKMKQWVDTFMRLPFNKYANLPITAEDGVEKCHEFMSNAQKTLNEAVYGMNDAKMQILQMVGQWITNPHAIGTAIAIKGPMGTGKTTLVKDGISKILGREFAFIALGGATDSSVLEGHSYTYEGSTWGKIVDILVQCKTMNPVIYFDELDKISNTPRGEEIASILTHLTDTTQNDKFHDKYFAEIDLDLSKCMFIFSYNDEDKVNPILKDRMYRISTNGYTVKEKKIIVEDYLLPKIREQMKFEKGDIFIDEEVLKYVIDRYTNEEKGVRNLKRCIETIYRKLNLFRLMRAGENLFEDDLAIKVEFPMKITTEVVDKVIKINEEDNKTHVSMYM